MRSAVARQIEFRIGPLSPRPVAREQIRSAASAELEHTRAQFSSERFSESEKFIAIAYELGREDGLADRHYTPPGSQSGRLRTRGEILAWLDGWRAGKAVLSGHKAEIQRLKKQIEEGR